MVGEKKKRVFRLSDFQPLTVEWLWPARLAAGKVTLIDGDPDQGKSLLTLDLVARLTRARPMPDGPALPQPVSVVLIVDEDGVHDTIQPRLRAAGADLDRVHVFAGGSQEGVGDSPPLFPDDCDLLRETIHETGARLVVVDPLTAVLGAGSGGLNGPPVRRALRLLARVGEETRTGILLFRHLNKAGRGQRALYRGGGSMAIIGLARTAFLVGSHPDDDKLHVLACTKNNLAEPPAALGFRILPGDQGNPVVSWTGAVDISADELVLVPRPSGQALRQARDFLEELLHRGPCLSEEAQRQAQAAGISRRTLERAKADLHVVSVTQITGGEKHWYWQLRVHSHGAGSPSWTEEQQRALALAQKDSDEFMAHIREKYGSHSGFAVRSP